MLENISKNHSMALMSTIEKKYLHELSKTIPSGGLVLEVGTFMGGSASIIAHANPNITVHSIDFYLDSHDRQKPLEDNINFWSKLIKCGGYLLIHDHRPHLPIEHPSRFLDTETCAVKLLENGYKKIKQVDGLLVLQKL